MQSVQGIKVAWHGVDPSEKQVNMSVDLSNLAACSPLIGRMREALEEHRGDGLCLHVSVADEETRERSPGRDYFVLVRWLCWGLERDSQELTELEFAVLSPEITAERLREELPKMFSSDMVVVVDNDIEV